MSDAPDRAIFSALADLARVDGRFSPEERAWILQVIDEAGLQDAEAQPLDREALLQAVRTPKDRRDFLRFAMTVAMADGHVAVVEDAWIRGLAAEFGLSPEEFEELKATTRTPPPR